MKDSIIKLENLLQETALLFAAFTDAEIEFKPEPAKWSKKEILGHLIDSALNNLQRFTEIQFEPKPYRIRNYKQDELVIANGYHQAPLQDLMDTWFTLNRRIVSVIKQQTPQTIAYMLIKTDNKTVTLEEWFADYTAHTEHHIEQIRW